jgi:type IV pilus assembly protein PilQ
VKLKYLRPEKVIEMLPQSISSEAAIKPVREDNGIVIMATSDVISQFDAFVRAIDKPVPQVLIEALVVDYNLTKSSQLGVGAGFRNSPDTSSQDYTLIPGINYTGNGYSINADLKRIGTLNIFGTSLGIANLGILPQNFYLSLQALEQKGVADVRSRPLLATLNGYPASLSIGTTQYYELTTTIPYNGQNNTTVFQQSQSFQKIEADVKLEITPYVGENGMIVVDIKPDFESPVGQLSPNIPPTIEHRSLSSTLEMKDGETIVLGGMIQNTTSLTKTATPILGDIPILGALFSSTSKSDNKSELMIYITPHISYGDEFRDASLPDKDKKQ